MVARLGARKLGKKGFVLVSFAILFLLLSLPLLENHRKGKIKYRAESSYPLA